MAVTVTIIVAYCACLSLSVRAILVTSSCLTSSVRPYCGLSRHSSTFGRYVRFSRRVSASFIGFILARIASWRRRISSSTSAISSSVCEHRQNQNLSNRITFCPLQILKTHKALPIRDSGMFSTKPDLLLLPVELVERPLKLMNALSQRVVSRRALRCQIVVRLMEHLMVGLTQAARVWHLCLGTLLVVPAEVLPLLRSRTTARRIKKWQRQTFVIKLMIRKYFS